jgi:hypothetical protein
MIFSGTITMIYITTFIHSFNYKHRLYELCVLNKKLTIYEDHKLNNTKFRYYIMCTIALICGTFLQK